MIRALARAKINWTLDITATRENGYHDLDMLMQSISLYDVLTFEEADDVTLMTDGAPDPYGEKNLIVRAARILQSETGCTKGAYITLEKNTPAMAGLGGGSADCAAALIALNELWKLGLSKGKLLELGFKLGADVPFCLTGGLARVSGLGEILRPLECRAFPEMLLIMPDGGLSTGAVFGGYDRTERTMPAVDTDRAERALLAGDFEELEKCAANALTEPAKCVSAAVGQAIDDLYAHHAVMARMSGSGSAVFAVFADADAAQHAQEALSGKYPFCKRIMPRTSGVLVTCADRTIVSSDEWA